MFMQCCSHLLGPSPNLGLSLNVTRTVLHSSKDAPLVAKWYIEGILKPRELMALRMFSEAFGRPLNFTSIPPPKKTQKWCFKAFRRSQKELWGLRPPYASQNTLFVLLGCEWGGQQNPGCCNIVAPLWSAVWSQSRPVTMQLGSCMYFSSFCIVFWCSPVAPLK